jgi:hypothetical protein
LQHVFSLLVGAQPRPQQPRQAGAVVEIGLQQGRWLIGKNGVWPRKSAARPIYTTACSAAVDPACGLGPAGDQPGVAGNDRPWSLDRVILTGWTRGRPAAAGLFAGVMRGRCGEEITARAAQPRPSSAVIWPKRDWQVWHRPGQQADIWTTGAFDCCRPMQVILKPRWVRKTDGHRRVRRDLRSAAVVGAVSRQQVARPERRPYAPLARSTRTTPVTNRLTAK